MAVGDINGDGLDDIFVGHGWEYLSIQQEDGPDSAILMEVLLPIRVLFIQK